MRIEKLIGETTEYDKKLTLEEKKPKSWLKSVSAFANGKGGILFFGVANDDTLIGLTDARTVSEKISKIIKTRMDLEPEFYSDATSFWVTLYNLNYNVEIDRAVVLAEKQLLGNEKAVVLTEKQSFDSEKTVVSNEKQLFEQKMNELRIRPHTKRRILELYEEIGLNAMFSRIDVMRITGITSSPAGELIKKMKKENLIEAVTGYGKGKYRFR